ncbi:MAG: hypothetical protein L0312_33330 [Acidobacteria bacterium]|nr:hypothetical protein [Acidobacteriota bacterium]
MEFHFQQLAPEMEWREAKVKLWRSVDVFGVEGSPEKEAAIRTQILGSCKM